MLRADGLHRGVDLPTVLVILVLDLGDAVDPDQNVRRLLGGLDRYCHVVPSIETQKSHTSVDITAHRLQFGDAPHAVLELL